MQRFKDILCVVDPEGRTGIPGYIICNTAEDILNQIDYSILEIKPLGFISPITIKK